MLPRRPLGKTGIQVSALGLGTVKFGRNQGVKYPQEFELPSDQQIVELLAEARNLGINVLDTAPAYGLSEMRLGQLMGYRHDWVIIDKVGEQFEAGLSTFDFSPEGMRHSLEQSLRLLKTDYIDILLLHSDGRDIELINQGCLETLARFQQEGKIRSCGLSGKSLEGALACLAQTDVAMVTYHPHYRDEEAALDYAAAHQKSCLIKKALASGHIHSMEQAQEHLRFCYQHPGCSSIVVGTLNPKHLKQNAAAFL